MSIAIIGASNNRDRYSNKAVRAYKSKGFKVYAVNPNEDTVEGLRCYSSIKDIPSDVSEVSIYVSPSVGIKLVDEITDKGIKNVYLNPGSESDDLIIKFKSAGINPLLTCSIRAIGIDPSEL